MLATDLAQLTDQMLAVLQCEAKIDTAQLMAAAQNNPGQNQHEEQGQMWGGAIAPGADAAMLLS